MLQHQAKLVRAYETTTMVPIAKQDIRFCKTVDGVTIAYSTMGQGLPIIIPPQFVTHLESDLIEGPLAEVYEALAQHCMVVRFDKRGTGLSERDASDYSSDESFVLDLEAVVDELRLEKFALYGFSAGGLLALHYYAKHPDRVSHLFSTVPIQEGPMTTVGNRERLCLP